MQAQTSTRISPAAKRYATALFQLAKDGGGLDAVRSDLNNLQQMVDSSPDLQALIHLRAISASDKQAAMVALAEKAGLTTAVVSTLALLCQNRRLNVLPEIIVAYNGLHDASLGIVHVVATSARPISKDILAKMLDSIEKSTGKSPRIENRLDASVLGGMRLQIGSRVIDNTLQGRLGRFQKILQEG